MKNLVCFVLAVVLVSGLNGQVVINEMLYDPSGTDTGNEWIELYNPGGGAVNMSGYCLYASGEHFVFPAFILNAGAYVVVHWNADGVNTPTVLYTGTTDWSNMGNTAEAVALWNTHDTHSNSTIIDYLEYGDSDNPFDGIAESAGIWFEGDFVPDVESGHSIEYDGSGNSSSDYIDQANPTPNSDNSLPVDLSSFSAQQKDKCVEIRWATQSELNNSGFYVLRSENEKEGYQKISALISGAGSSSEKHSYVFTDKRIEPNRTYFYQLQQIDMDGTVESYGPVEVVIQLQDESLYEIPKKSKLVGNYPNPFNPGTTLFIAQKETEDVAISVYDIMGRKINTLYAGMLDAGQHEMPWNGLDQNGMQAPSGHYFVKMQTNSGKISVLKVLKLQ